MAHANAVELLLGPAALARHGERTALICGDQHVTFAALAASVGRAAGVLASFGVLPGDRVLVLLRDTPEFAAAWLGAVRLGAVAVALNSKLGDAEYRHIVSDSRARFAVVEDVFAAARPDLTAELAREGRIAIAGERSVSLPDWRERMRASDETPPFDATGDTPAFMLYSSGTTGLPKGMLHSHRSLSHAGAACRAFGLGEGDLILATSKMFFAYGLEHALIAPLALGATSILSADWPTARSVAELVAQHRPSAVFSVPTMYRRIVAEVPGTRDQFRGVRRCIAAGEHPSVQLAEQWRAATGHELLNLYGMSETFCACMVTPPGSADGLRTGLPLEGVEARLESGDTPDSPPVLWLRHPAQTLRYENRPAETAAQFRDGWFCTRDVFALDADGYYVYQGRSDDLVKIAGQWVRPAELEGAVAALAEVAEAACVAVPDADGLDRLALFIAARPGARGALDAAVAACAQALPGHKRPKWLRVIDQLPRTATGKVQRFKLRELLAAELSGRR